MRPEPPADKAPVSSMPGSQVRIENVIQQMILLKKAQDQLSGEQAHQNASALLASLCQPMAQQGPAHIAPHLAQLRQKLPRFSETD